MFLEIIAVLKPFLILTLMTISYSSLEYFFNWNYSRMPAQGS